MASLLVYGYPLTHFSLPIDGEFADNFAQTIAFGRWGHSLLRAWLLPEPFTPFFTLLVALLALSLAATLGARLLRLSGAGALLFTTLLVGFPQLAYQFEFINQADTLAIGYLLGIASVWLFVNALALRGAPRWGGLLLATGCYVYAIGIYQSLVVIPPLMLLGRLAFIEAGTDASGDDARPRIAPRQGLAQLAGFALLSLVALALYVAITRWTQAHFAIAGSSYLAGFVNLGLGPWAYLHAVTAQLAQGLGGRQNFGLASFALASAAAALLLATALLRWRTLGAGRSAYRWLLTLGMLLLPFVFCLTSRYALPPRIFVATSLSLALLVTLALYRRDPRWLLGLAALLLLIHGARVSQLFASDAAVRQADVLMANRIATALYLQYPDFDPARTPVYFHGGIANDSVHKLPRSDVFGSSFFAWDGGNNIRLRLFFRYYGIGDWRNADRDETRRALHQVEAMPIWPNPGAIQRHDGVMIVKLGAHRGWLPFSVE
ncbi:glucosyltransferase domain-containing protein [Salinicola sp. JS01]|uniref:glucosyltransferase domain-containing protein n=1 Tax=Salinicola sp. JS01 TaxID=3050071 RepID=UPI00255BF8B9|nr:glucosyltransferase domain-containing protein [Salinicola sp. JS01]WIX33799.1 glucosyltransferase domain-containing protein [Salinicola sp. JS01]